MTRNLIALIGFVLLAGCSGGGDESTPASVQSEAPTPRSPQPPPPPVAQPDMLTATPQGILRGKANGQGQREILRAPNLNQFFNVFVDQGHIVYARNDRSDIWTVLADGTGDRALLNTPNEELLFRVSWPWIIFADDFAKSLNVETKAQFRSLFVAIPWSVRIKDDRVIYGDDLYVYSETLTGTDPIFHSTGTHTDLSAPAIVEDRLVYQGYRFQLVEWTLFSAPIIGGTPLVLDSASYVSFARSIGARVVYHRCPGFCDVVSVNSDGSSPVVLASDPANEAVQGVTTTQVIIRRNLSGNDQLIAVPVSGGAETLLMTMTDNEFVDTIVEDTIIVRRPSGTWTLNLSGTLKQLNNIAGLDGFVPVGNAICSSDPVWCMPLDGSTPAVKIADDGRVVGVL